MSGEVLWEQDQGSTGHFRLHERGWWEVKKPAGWYRYRPATAAEMELARLLAAKTAECAALAVERDEQRHRGGAA